MTEIDAVVSIEGYLVLTRYSNSYTIICVAVVRMKVEYKDQTPSFEGNYFISFMMTTHIGRVSWQEEMFLVQMLHVPVKVPQVTVSEEIIVHQIELSSGIVITEIVSLREKKKIESQS